MIRHNSDVVDCAASKPVVEYLAAIGDADNTPVEPTLAGEQLNALAGSYEFGTGPDECSDITVAKDRLSITRPGHTPRTLMHVGSVEFFPGGAEAVRIAFAPSVTGMTLTVRDPDVMVVATRKA